MTRQPLTDPETYYESAIGIEISYTRAMQELRQHGVDFEGLQDFQNDIGVKERYAATEILDWLNY